MKMHLPIALAALIACGLPAVSLGQQTQDKSATAERQTAGFRGTDVSSQEFNQELLNYLAAKLMLANQCQVELAGMAAEKAEHPKVKQFAQMLTEEHQQLNQKLMQAMPGLKNVEPLSFAGSNRSAESNRGTVAATQKSDFLDGGAQTLIDIMRRAAENNHQSTKQMLSEKQGKKFDMCFVASEIGAHTWMVSELKAIQDVGPEQFTSIVRQALQKNESHLNTAKQLADTLMSSSDVRQTRISERDSDQFPQK